jgi:hypothetical protein
MTIFPSEVNLLKGLNPRRDRWNFVEAWMVCQTLGYRNFAGFPVIDRMSSYLGRGGKRVAGSLLAMTWARRDNRDAGATAYLPGLLLELNRLAPNDD